MPSTAIVKYDPHELEWVRASMRRMVRHEYDRRYVTFAPKPEKVYVRFEAAGLRCRILQGPLSINGYVVVPSTHPWYKVHYHECPDHCGEEFFCEHSPTARIRVHGGITYSGLGEDGWVFGFDTAHAGDYIQSEGIDMSGRIWMITDVKKETAYMAAQLSTVKRM